jgi:hypothetical protein
MEKEKRREEQPKIERTTTPKKKEGSIKMVLRDGRFRRIRDKINRKQAAQKKLKYKIQQK